MYHVSHLLITEEDYTPKMCLCKRELQNNKKDVNMIETVKQRPRLKGVTGMARRLGVTSQHLGRVLWGDSKPGAALAKKLDRIHQPYGEAFVKAARGQKK